jgi:CRISPR-associated protein Cmr2
MRDYISHDLNKALKLISELEEQETAAEEARRQRDNQRRTQAERKAANARDQLLAGMSPATLYEYLNATKGQRSNIDVNLRTTWQEKNRRVDCLQPLAKNWKEARSYWNMFAAPTIDLSILPAYSFAIQLTFRLAQPYISRDEKNFYIIDNPVRKDKLFGLPYIASTSWKGSLRSALWHLGHKEKDEVVRRLFGNEKETEDFRAGRLQFFPTFFTTKSLEVINLQDRKHRAGTDPIAFESVPEGSEGTFTLLYVPFDLIGESDAKVPEQVAADLKLVAQGIGDMFRTYGFGAKTSSGFGLARESVREGNITMRTGNRIGEFKNFDELVMLGDSWQLG